MPCENSACPVSISLSNESTGQLTVKILNDTRFTISRNLRFSVGPIAPGSITVIDAGLIDDQGNFASVKTVLPIVDQTRASPLQGMETIFRFGEPLPSGYTLVVNITAQYGNPVRACIECFTPEVFSKCRDMVTKQLDRANSTPKGIGCFCQICASLCFCNNFVTTQNDSQNYSIGNIDPTTGITSNAVPITFSGFETNNIGPIAVNPKTGLLYFVSGSGLLLPPTNSLYLLNSVSGVATKISNALSTDQVQSIAFNSYGDLYALTIGVGGRGTLLRINVDKETVSDVGTLDVFGGFLSMAFDNEDRLFVLQSAVTTTVTELNPNTAKSIPDSKITLDPQPTPAQLLNLIFDCSTNEARTVMTNTETSSQNLTQINVETGKLTVLQSITTPIDSKVVAMSC